MTHKIRNWLAAYFDTKPIYIEDMLNDEKATTYLLVWPVFEQMLFDGFMRKNDIEKVAGQLTPFYQEIDKEDSARYFHNRYQDSTKYHHLRHNDAYPMVDLILQKKYVDLSDKEKLILLIYVVYRYRNNIFHGNKGIESWSMFSDQIYRCINLMMSILDCAEKHKGEIV